MTSLRGARILAADLSLSCSGICIFDLDSMMPVDARAFPKADPGSDHSIYHRARTVVLEFDFDSKGSQTFLGWDDARFIAFEGPATNSRFRNEETSAIRQAFFDMYYGHDNEFVVVPPTSAKLALTGKGNADKMAMVNAALAQTRGTPFFDTLSALVKPGRKHNPEAEAISDAFGVARAAAKILFQRNARESSVPFR